MKKEFIYLLIRKSHTDGNREILNAYRHLKDAQEEMSEEYESSKKFWDELVGKDLRFEEIYVQKGEMYAEAYGIDKDYEQVGLSWEIERVEIKEDNGKPKPIKHYEVDVFVLGMPPELTKETRYIDATSEEEAEELATTGLGGEGWGVIETRESTEEE